MKGEGKAKSRLAAREISGDAAVDAALWQLADVLAEIARSSRADEQAKAELGRESHLDSRLGSDARSLHDDQTG